MGGNAGRLSGLGKLGWSSLTKIKRLRGKWRDKFERVAVDHSQNPRFGGKRERIRENERL